MNNWIKYILFVCLIGFYSCQRTNSFSIETPHSSTYEECSNIIDLQDTYDNRMHQQYDWTDAITSSQISNNIPENRLRTRRYERISTSWKLRTHIQHLHAALQRQAKRISHQLNHIVTLSRVVPLNLPPERISFPFHVFW